MSELRLPRALAEPLERGRAAAHATRLAAISPWVWVGLLTGASTVARGLASLRHTSPRLFPDEYIYATLARSLSEGRLAIRGVTPHFPALLQPLLTAPLWLTHDTGVAYALTQWLQALVMSLSAVPVYLLSKRLGLPAWQGVAAVAFTLALPVLEFSSFVTGDAVALPLALGALAAAVRALVRPTPRAQLGFLALAALASLARVQYVVLVAAFAAGALVMCRFRPLRTARAYPVVTAAVLLPLLGATAIGPRAALGYYAGIFDFNISPLAIGHWVAVDLMLLAYASGWVLIPAALAGLGACLVRPATPTEKAFGAVVTAFALLLLAEASLYASNGSERFQERYLMALLPLAPIAFGIGMRRLPSTRRPVVAIASALLVVPFATPLTGYAVGTGSQDSPFLQGISRISSLIGDYGRASLLVAITAIALMVLAILAAVSPRRGTGAALAVAVTVALAGSVAATSFDTELSRGIRAQNLPPDASWVDHLAPGAAMLLAPGSSRPLAATHLFWNTSIDRILVMAAANQLDEFGATPTAIDRDGRLVAGGKPIQGPLLVEEFGSTLTLSNAQRVADLATTTLWRATAATQVQTIAVGRYADGWLDRVAAISAWPPASGGRREVRVVLSLPSWAHEPAVLDVVDGDLTSRLRVAPGHSTVLQVPLKSHGETRIMLTSVSGAISDGSRTVSVNATTPELVASAP